MSARSHPLRWVPPLAVGLCTATAAEVAVALLLYNGPGFMRSLTAVLSIEAAAMGLGVWGAGGDEGDPQELLRRRWFFCMVAFLVATVFTASWGLVDALAGTALGQGLGLALLAALPLYGAGGVLGAMAAAAGRGAGGGVESVGGPALVGAALGFAATGAALPQVLTPASLFLVCLVLLSAGGLVYGSVLDARPRVHVRARASGGLGEVRVEDRAMAARGGVVRVLLEGGHVRRWMPLGAGGADPWDVAAFGALVGPDQEGAAVLLVGGGASLLPRRAMAERPLLRVDVVERSPETAELAREYLEAGPPPGVDGRASVRVGNLDDLIAGLGGRYLLVAVDAGALAPQGGVAALSAAAREALMRSVGHGGHLVIGPRAPEGGGWPFPTDWSVGRYVREVDEGLEGMGEDLPVREDVLVAVPPHGALPEALGPFLRLDVGEP